MKKHTNQQPEELKFEGNFLWLVRAVEDGDGVGYKLRHVADEAFDWWKFNQFRSLGYSLEISKFKIYVSHSQVKLQAEYVNDPLQSFKVSESSKLQKLLFLHKVQAKLKSSRRKRASVHSAAPRDAFIFNKVTWASCVIYGGV